jgi:hypothetical protein
MKPELQKIEATLGQIDAHELSINPRLGQSSTPKHTSISFEVLSKKSPQSVEETDLASSTNVEDSLPHSPHLPDFKLLQDSQTAIAVPSAPPANRAQPATKTLLGTQQTNLSFKLTAPSLATDTPDSLGETVRPLRFSDTTPRPLDLPKFKLPNFSTHRQVTKPEFAVGLLKEMEGIVTRWQKDLQKVQLQIQDLYLEGPVIDGWLESQPYESQTSGVVTIRHAEIDRLMEYVEEICKHPAPEEKNTLARTDYRLCGLNADGQLWSRPCPVEKVPQVSLAIARYQKLRQLLAQKHQLESRLDHFARALIELHRSLQETGKRE